VSHTRSGVNLEIAARNLSYRRKPHFTASSCQLPGSMRVGTALSVSTSDTVQLPYQRTIHANEEPKNLESDESLTQNRR
jgi:hypothetical protein